MSQYELNLRDYLRIFRKRKLVIILTFLAITIGSVIYTSMQQAIYQSSVTVKIEERKTIAGLLTEWIIYKPGNLIESQVRAIESYPILKKAGLRLGLLEDDSSSDKVNNAVKQLESQIDCERIGQTNMIKITATAKDPKEAMDLADTVANVYMEEDLLDKAKQFTQARQFIEEQLVSLEDRLKFSEGRLEKTGSDTRSAKFADLAQQKLIGLELELFDLLQRYTEKYPRVIQVKEQIKEIEAKLKAFNGDELGQAALTREIEINKKLYVMLKEKLEEMRITEAQKVGDISIISPAALPESPVSGNKNMIILLGALMGLILGFCFAFIFEALDTSISTIEDVENVLKLPVLGMIPSIDSGFKKDNGIFTKLREIFHPVSAGIEQERLVSLISHYKPRSPASEAYRNVQTNLKLNLFKKTILVTSSGPREGKSTVVSNLGIVMAQSGLKTLLVSFDLRRPVLAKNFGVQKFPGINELIIGTASFEGIFKNITDILMGDLKFEDIRKTQGLENISIIPSGNLPSNPVELLKTGEIARLIEKLKNQFDVIIFDSPPVLPVTDASLLAPNMDCVIIVYEIGRTSREALLRTKVQLEAVGAKIAGVVLNHTQAQTEAVAAYPYYSHKYRYYGKDAAENKAMEHGGGLFKQKLTKHPA